MKRATVFLFALIGFYTLSSYAGEVPFTFDASQVGAISSGTLSDGTAFGGNSVQYNTSQFSGQSFQSDTYGGLVSQVKAVASQGLGSGIGTCNSCDCATSDKNSTITLLNMSKFSTAQYIPGPLIEGQYTNSVSGNTYPSVNGSFFCAPKTEFTFIGGAVTGSSVPQCVAVAFDYDIHVCEKTSQDPEPFTATKTIISKTGSGTILAMRNIPCPVDPRHSNGAPASILIRNLVTGDSNCQGDALVPADEKIVVQLQSGFSSGQRAFTSAEKLVVPSVVESISIPLGAHFLIGLEDSVGTILTELAMVVNSPLSNNMNGLFADKTLYTLDSPRFSDTKGFVATHLGVASFNLIDQNGLSYTIDVNVVKPASLGSTIKQFDDNFVQAAHDQGVLPQLLKGMAERESGNANKIDPMAYRYEPFWDLRHFSNISTLLFKGRNLAIQKPYSSYRFATQGGLTQGSDFLSQVLSGRNDYWIVENGILRMILDTDGPLEALTIVEVNDVDYGQNYNKTPQNWLEEARKSKSRLREIALKDPNVFRFTAQTSISSSYGLLQVLYTSAINPMHWTGTKPSGTCFSNPSNCAPSSLYDTPSNITNGGGSINLGSRIIVRGYRKYVMNLPNMTVGQHENNFAIALQGYNDGQGYGPDVLQRSTSYYPVLGRAIFN